jgi:hypothetical protein
MEFPRKPHLEKAAERQPLDLPQLTEEGGAREVKGATTTAMWKLGHQLWWVAC